SGIEPRRTTYPPSAESQRESAPIVPKSALTAAAAATEIHAGATAPATAWSRSLRSLSFEPRIAADDILPRPSAAASTWVLVYGRLPNAGVRLDPFQHPDRNDPDVRHRGQEEQEDRGELRCEGIATPGHSEQQLRK